MATTDDSPGNGPGRVRFSADAGIGWIVLENPTKYNAISLEMCRSMIELLARLDRDPAIRCVVIRGEGDRAFCAGADISEKHDVDDAQALKDLDLGLAALKAVREFSKPTIAMVSGYCLGAGVGIALSCDMRIAAGNASFGIPAARLGLAYFYPDIKRLTDLVGPAVAKQIIFTAERVPAERAFQIGLVNEVVAPGDLLPFVSAMAGRIAANAPLTIAAARYAITVALSDPPGREIADCEARARACLASDDYTEGTRAFKEKRPPVFKGR